MTLYEIIDEVKADGFSLGRAEGLEAGALQTRIETAKNAIQMGFPYEQIALLTGLSIEEINEIADEMNAENY